MGERSRSRSHPSVAVIVLGAFLLAEFAVLPLLSLAFPGLGGYPRWAASSAAEVLICLVAAAALLRGGPVTALRGLGLWASPLSGFVIGLLATLPLPVIYAAIGSFDDGIDPVRLMFLAGISPFVEEVVFRGFAFWLLYRLAGWNFWLAVLVPALIFAAEHLYQAQDPASAAGIFAITALGGVWFSWLLLRWNNLWVPIAMHMLMNGWWNLFAVDDTALGGVLANLARVLTLMLSIVLTVYRDRLPGLRPVPVEATRGDGVPAIGGKEG